MTAAIKQRLRLLSNHGQNTQDSEDITIEAANIERRRTATTNQLLTLATGKKVCNRRYNLCFHTFTRKAASQTLDGVFPPSGGGGKIKGHFQQFLH